VALLPPDAVAGSPSAGKSLCWRRNYLTGRLLIQSPREVDVNPLPDASMGESGAQRRFGALGAPHDGPPMIGRGRLR
jgi:hypothetical protein